MRVAGTVAAVLMLAGCGGKPKSSGPVVVPGGGPGTEPETVKAVEPPKPPLPAPPSDLAKAELMTIGGGEITAYDLDGGKVTELGTAVVAQVDPENYLASISGDWADHDHFFVHIPPRDVVVVTADRMTRIEVPPEAAFETPKPDGGEDVENLKKGGLVVEGGTGLVLTDGSAWWVECPWGYPYDGWQCEVWTHAKLWLVDKPVVEPGRVIEDEWGWPTQVASGFRTKELDDGRALGCTPPPGTKQKQSQFRGREDEGEMIMSHHWVSVSPPRLLVIYGTPGMDDLSESSFALHDGCLPKPLAVGVSAEPGPDGLWVGWETHDLKAEKVELRTVVHRGAEVLGELSGGAVKFRPPAAAPAR